MYIYYDIELIEQHNLRIHFVLTTVNNKYEFHLLKNTARDAFGFENE